MGDKLQKCRGAIQTVEKQIQHFPQPVKVLTILAVAACLPLFVKDIYYLNLLFMVGVYATLAIGLSIMVGQAGILSMGYAAFFGIGAYTTAIMCVRYGFSFWLTIPCAMIAAGLSGVIIGWPVLRIRGDYLAMITLGFGEIVRITFNNLTITGGADGIYGVPAPRIGSLVVGEPWQHYYLALLIVFLSWIFARRLSSSRIGRAWACTRDDEYAAEAMGINTVWTKLLAFIVASMWAGLAGSVFVGKMTAVAPESFLFMQSFMILLSVVIGGMNNVTGVVLGAAIIIILPELFRGFEAARMLAFGITLVLVMIYKPGGLFPAREKASSRGN